MKTIYCNNCGNDGHYFNQCNYPITSLGIIAFRNNNGVIEYLMIRRRDTLGYIDFLRGKYNINNISHIKNIIDEMTDDEKKKILNSECYSTLNNENKYSFSNTEAVYKFKNLKNGIFVDKKKITLNDIISNSKTRWKEQEWGFPKGRRNYKETNIDCAIREWSEETGYNNSKLKIVDNIEPFEEIFMGSNYKSYKHLYYLAYTDEYNSCDNYQKQEVSKMLWMPFEKCIELIRPYNLEKKNILTKINKILNEYTLYT